MPANSAIADFAKGTDQGAGWVAKDPRAGLIDRARAGDGQAFEMLVALAPKPLPNWALRQLRDAAIRGADQFLQAACTGQSVRGRAKLIAAAGTALWQHGRIADRPPFSILTDAEREELTQIVAPAASMKWPRWRQIITISIS